MSEAGTLRAMVRNYRMNNLWDHLDAEACTKAANKIEALTAERDKLKAALSKVGELALCGKKDELPSRCVLITRVVLLALKESA